MNFINQLKSMLGGNRVDVAARFQKVRQSVSGTMSQFQEVIDRQTGEVVGLKVLDLEKTRTFEDRFKSLKKPTEGTIAMTFSHPRIVNTLEHGYTSKGEQYIVMEFLEGPGLQHLINHKSKLLFGKWKQLFEQMTEAVGAVHNAGYIHRDICPRNFICSEDCESLKLIDFGLTLPATKDFMQPGNRTGTPLYMAPEVVRRRWTDHRVDIFALGVTAYQLCTFEFPWPIGDASGMAALSHDTQEPQDIFDYRPELNPLLGKVIMKCIEPNPENRPDSAGAILRSLRKVEGDLAPGKTLAD